MTVNATVFEYRFRTPTPIEAGTSRTESGAKFWTGGGVESIVMTIGLESRLRRGGGGTAAGGRDRQFPAPRQPF